MTLISYHFCFDHFHFFDVNLRFRVDKLMIVHDDEDDDPCEREEKDDHHAPHVGASEVIQESKSRVAHNEDDSIQDFQYSKGSANVLLRRRECQARETDHRNQRLTQRKQ